MGAVSDIYISKSWNDPDLSAVGDPEMKLRETLGLRLIKIQNYEHYYLKLEFLSVDPIQ